MDPMSLSKTELEALTSPHLRITDNSLDQNELAERCPLNNGRHACEQGHSLGRLGLLPPELLNTVLSQLDLQSLTDFRRINQRAMHFVDSVPQYQLILEHTPAALRGMLSIKCARFSTCQARPL